MTNLAEKLRLAAIASKESAELSESEVENMMKTVEEKALALARIGQESMEVYLCHGLVRRTMQSDRLERAFKDAGLQFRPFSPAFCCDNCKQHGCVHYRVGWRNK